MTRTSVRVQNSQTDGHEFTHSVVETSANLGYDATKESAALNESFSDIFGEMAEAWEESQTNPDWIVGADKCSAGLTCRNMQNPKAYSQPLVEDLSIYPAGDTDFFRVQPPEASGPSGRCFSQGIAFTFPADVDVRAYQDGKLIKRFSPTR